MANHHSGLTSQPRQGNSRHMQNQSVNLRAKFNMLDAPWTPKVVAELNDYQIKVVKLSGQFVWHSHDDTDEMFLCVEGRMDIELRDGCVTLEPGELFVVPKGVAHKPVAHDGCSAVIIEPRGIVNTGASGGDLTAPNDEWL